MQPSFYDNNNGSYVVMQAGCDQHGSGRGRSGCEGDGTTRAASLCPQQRQGAAVSTCCCLLRPGVAGPRHGGGETGGRRWGGRWEGVYCWCYVINSGQCHKYHMFGRLGNACLVAFNHQLSKNKCTYHCWFSFLLLFVFMAVLCCRITGTPQQLPRALEILSQHFRANPPREKPGGAPPAVAALLVRPGMISRVLVCQLKALCQCYYGSPCTTSRF